MLQLSEEFASGAAGLLAHLRLDVHGSQPRERVLDELTFLNYRLGSVAMAAEITRPTPDVIWHQDAPDKAIRYEEGQLVLEGEWYQGEVQKLLITMLTLRMEEVGLHPFHSSAIRYRDRTVLFITGETNHGKTMSQIEGCRRGGLVISTETTVTDERGWVITGSKSVFLRTRSKGTERADKPNQDVGVAKFFDKTPEFVTYDEPCDVDLIVVPDIDGHFDTAVVELSQFEKEFQIYHSLMDYWGLNQLLAPGLPTPVLDDDARRIERAGFCHSFARRPCYLIRANTPQIVLDEVEKRLP
jgi:hypothetical protein